MADLYTFPTDKINIFLLIIDRSGSMEKHEWAVRKGLRLFKKNFENFPEENSLAVSVSKFSSSFYPNDFTRVNSIDTNYATDGATALYYSIVKGAEKLQKYAHEVAMRCKIKPRLTYIFFSDGEPYNDMETRDNAIKAITNLNLAGVTTVFVAFGDAINREFGNKLGFQSTIDVTNTDTLESFLGVELSKSCKEQSRSMKPLAGNFFSKATYGRDSKNYSQKTEQVLSATDTSWIDEI